LFYQVPNPSKLRVDLRFFADLISAGVFTEKVGLPVLANQLKLLIANDKDEHNNVSIILSFCKHCGDDYAGLLSQKYRWV
jgi:regulator of nonsense transcripts 2